MLQTSLWQVPQRVTLFRRLISTKNGQKLCDSANLSYTRARELVLTMLESVGLDCKQFSLHSLCAGGAIETELELQANPVLPLPYYMKLSEAIYWYSTCIVY